MPVYNAEKYLSQAIESVLNQSYKNFEFIIVNDASTDNSWKIIKSFGKKDKRIIAIKNPINLGVSLSSNIAISKAKGQFLARMDADDISFENRLQKQLNFLIKNRKIVAAGGQCVVINDLDQVIGHKNFPTKPSLLRDMIFWAIPLQQPSMMINLKKLPKNFKWFTPNQSSAEEVDVIFRLMQYGNIANLPDYLLFYRHLNSSLSHLNPKKTFLLTLKSRILACKLGFNPSFKAICLNLAQMLAISLLPNPLINEIWYRVRGINKPISGLTVGTFSEAKV